MADPRIPVNELGEFRMLIQEMRRRLDELEKPTGTQLSKAVEKILELFDNLDAQVAAAIATNSYTKAQINALTWAVSAITGVLTPGQGGTGTGNVHNKTGTGTQLQVYVMPSGELTVGASSERYKDNITDWGVDIAALMSLAPRLFEWRDFPGEVDIGLIAEEAYAAGLPWLVRFDGPVIEGVRYDRLPVALLAVAQHQQSRLEEIEGTLAGVLSRLAALEGA